MIKVHKYDDAISIVGVEWVQLYDSFAYKYRYSCMTIHSSFFSTMGNKHVEYRHESLHSSRRAMSVTHLYESCRDGDVEQVRRLLPHLSQTDLKYQNPYDGNTCLHIAVINGHTDVVKLLLKSGCYRSRCLNSSNQTAYDLACLKNDSTRSLFLRQDETDPLAKSAERFSDQNVSKCFDIVTVEPELNEKSAKLHRQAPIQTFETEAEKQHEIGYAASSKAMCQSSFGRFCVNRFHSDEPLNNETILWRLHRLLNDTNVNNSDDYLKIQDLIHQFEQNTNSIEHLLHLYTLETRFYRILKEDCMPLAMPLFMNLQKLKYRFFKGRVYRGMRMSSEQISIYQIAMEMSGTLLQTKSFSSTSMNRNVAEEFAYLKSKNPENNFCVLFIFDFPDISDQAINLSRLASDIPSISEYEDEEEVLILPWTLFEVTQIRPATDQDCLYKIHLTNRPIPKKGLLSTFKWTIADIKHQMAKSGKVKFECAFQKYKH